MSRFSHEFIRFHFKNWTKTSKISIGLRLLSIIGLLTYGIMDTVMYSNKSKDKSDPFQLIHSSRYIPIEIFIILYGTSSVAFGISIEVYFLLVQAIINAILVKRTCHGSDESMAGIVWIVKLVIFFPGVELCHRNFRQLQKYNEYFNSSTLYMLRQGFFIGLAMVAENLDGLKTVFIETNSNIPHLCKYETSICGIVNFYKPYFSYDNLICIDHLSEYAFGREQIRILRNFILLNIASYSVFNKHFLKINRRMKYLYIRILLILLLTVLSTSMRISHIDPLFFVQSNCRLVYTILEFIIFIIIMELLILNYYQLRHFKDNLLVDIGEMDEKPSLLPKD